ncbi:MAG: hypothetical protein L0154_28565 [Chloroflexi bacterium]|nr:hypothetical protein [Chloroflexota bacterium]
MKKTRPGYLLLILLFLIAARLIINLDMNSLWVDEGWSVAATSKSLWDVTTLSAEDVHPPLYFYILYKWRLAVGDSIFALRYLTAITVLLTAALIFRYSEEIMSGSGWIAVLIFGLHDLVLVLGQEIRQYPQMMLLAVLTLWAYRHHRYLFVLSGALLLWTHYWGGFILLAIGLCTLILNRRQLKQTFIALGVIGALFLPWALVVYQQISTEIPEGLGHALVNSEETYRILAYQLLGQPELLFLVLMIFGLISYQPPRLNKRSALLGLAIFCTVGLTVLINAFYQVLSFRALSVIVPVAAILIAQAVAQFRSPERSALVIFLVLQGVFITNAQPPIRLPWQSVADYVSQHSGNQEAVIIETWFDTHALVYYFDQHSDAPHVITAELDRYDHYRDKPDEYGQYLLDSVDEYDGLWLVRFGETDIVQHVLRENGWLVTGSTTQATDLGATVELLRLDRPPTNEPMTVFGEQLHLYNADVQVLDSGVSTTFLWSPEDALEQAYTISVFLLDSAGRLVVQQDTYPLTPTQNWQTGQFYFDSRFLSFSSLPPGVYTVGVKVYYFTDPAFQNLQILPVEPCSRDNCEFLEIEAIEVK